MQHRHRALQKEHQPILLSVALLIIMVPLLLVYLKAQAATINWTGGGITHNWSEAANWSTNSVPTASDYVVFSGTANKNALIDTPVSVGGIDLGAGYSGTITQAAGAPLTITRYGFFMKSGTFAGSDADITVTGNVQVTGGSFLSTSGTLQLSGNWTANSTAFNANGGTVAFNGGYPHTLHTLSGSTTFHGLSLRSTTATMKFVFPGRHGETQVINGMLTLSGATGSVLTFASDATGTANALPALIDVRGGTRMSRVHMTDIRNTNALVAACEFQCVDGGGVINWTFPIHPDFLLEAWNIDGEGTQNGDAAARTDLLWKSLSTAGGSGALANISLPATADSGWQGTGLTTDPYRLRLDGVNDVVSVGTIGNIKSYALWFNADTVSTAGRDKCIQGGDLSSRVVLHDGVITPNFTDGSSSPRPFSRAGGIIWPSRTTEPKLAITSMALCSRRIPGASTDWDW